MSGDLEDILEEINYFREEGRMHYFEINKHRVEFL